jgi:dolichol-phosphate mannosyltransferase
MKIAVIIPTYNEKENIKNIISGIFNLRVEGLNVIVVDDDSPDGTGMIVEEMKVDNGSIHIIHRTKKMGLGTAYLEGFQYAIDNRAEYIFEMDADFSHDLSMIPLFLKNIKNHDLVLGSRYISQGKIINWNPMRRFFSRFGNIYAKVILRLPIEDLTSGYKCYRRSVIEHLKSRKIDSIGYVFQIETTYHAYNQGFKIKEIPITFTERKIGKSKFNGKILWESFWKVFKLRFKR